MPPPLTPEAQNPEMPQVLKVGDEAPAFALPDPSGTLVSSAALLKKGPLVATFYRGVWCPYCQADLKELATDDKNGEAAVAFGIRWSPQQLQAMQEQQMILTGLNAEPSRLLPMQARYVIGRDGAIVYADINFDYRKRPEPSEILPVLRHLQGGAGS